MNYLNNKKAFTLIELIIVVVIIGILASIAAPMMQTMKNRAIAAEAVTALGALKTGMQTYYAQYQSYPKPGSKWLADGLGHTGNVISSQILDAMQINSADFQGQYFPSSCYYISSSNGSTYTIQARINIIGIWYVPQDSDAAKLCDTSTGSHCFTINQKGTITQTGLTGTGY